MRGVTPSVTPLMLRPAFQLTRLMRGVTCDVVFCAKRVQFQLTRLMRGVTSGCRDSAQA